MTQLFATEHPIVTGQDISSLEFWRRPPQARLSTFAWLREHAPVSWHAPLETEGLPDDVAREAGFWAVTRAEDIQLASRHHELFSSAVNGSQLLQFPPDHMLPPTFLEMDPPQHTRYRKIMSAAFTPKAVARLDSTIRLRAHAIVAAVVGAGDIDLVRDVSSKLPMRTVADMVGVPESLVEEFAHAGDGVLSARDEAARPEGVSADEFFASQMAVLREIGTDLVSYRRKHPGDDIATALAAFEVDGRPLSGDDIGAMMLLLSAAGNDTTKQTTSFSVLAMDQNPDQKAWLAHDFDGRSAGAIEELIRHASPVIQFARTATEDIELGGQLITAGDRVGLFYSSGNRDERVFDEPDRFLLSRPIGPHVGFGGGGVHFCLGNNVARAQLRALFREILVQLPDLHVVGEPEYLFSEHINGIRVLPVRTH